MNEHLTAEQKDSYGTPQYLFDYYHRYLGYDFEVDLFANKTNHKCNKFFSLENSFLTAELEQIRDAVCWANPPYSKPKIYIDRMLEARDKVNATIVALLPVDVSTQWFKSMIDSNVYIQFLTGNRVPFIHPVQGNGRKIMRGNLIAIFTNQKLDVIPQVFLDLSEIELKMSEYYAMLED